MKIGIRTTLALLTIVVALPLTAAATGQQPDILIYKGKTYDLFANPLESFYKNEKDKPLFRVRPNVMSTGNWRGYVATWKIENGFLYLVKLDAWICRDWAANTCTKVNLRRLFGKRYRNGRILASWFSGDLRMPDGKMLQYVHMGYGSVYEKEITLQVKSGKVVAESTVDNTQRALPSQLELQRQELEKMKPKPPL
jgi:hypothetical protein